MSFAISAVSHANPSYEPTAVAKPAAKLTTAQQLHTLATEGQSAKQIATTLGLPETLVEEDLGTASTAATVVPAGLSIRV